jgi:hypothetical protein
MHATFRQHGPTEPGRPIRGTFYPSEGPGGGGSIAAALPKLLAIVVAMAVVRTVLGGARRHGSSSRWSRRREAIAEFHRDLHAHDAADQPAESTGPADKTVKA